MELKVIKGDFSVCKVADYSLVDLKTPYIFTAVTGEENSLVCPTRAAPRNTLRREDGWKLLRVTGSLEFSLVGILAGITGTLAAGKVPVFAVSTYDTDYIFLKDTDFEKALGLLKGAGYRVVG